MDTANSSMQDTTTTTNPPNQFSWTGKSTQQLSEN